jgi:cell wall-associated NlpC family hydrolase
MTSAPIQTLERTGPTVTIRRGSRVEVHIFASPEEAAGRMAIVEEAMSWVGTPFVNCADIKGPAGAVDCAMLLVRCYVDTGRLAPFDPRPYPPNWHIHRNEQRFLGWIQDRLGAQEVAEPKLGDVVIWQFGRCFAHGAILINTTEVVHAYAVAGLTLVSGLTEPSLDKVPLGGKDYQRPRKFFDVWTQA